MLKPGTAIATFVNGKYPNAAHGNHAALYVKQDMGGIWVADQWKDKKQVTIRKLPFLGKNRYADYTDPSNNGDAFSVID